VFKDDPGGLLDFDLEYPTALSEQRSSVDSIEQDEMMANWEINEVFQDLSSVFDVGSF